MRFGVMPLGLYDAGSGTPIVVVPGITGRWEWIEPALQALTAYGRTLSYSLGGEPGSGRRARAVTSFDDLVTQLADVLDRADVPRVLVCGVSFGGYVALRFTARHPDRVLGLVLASSPGPRFALDARQRGYLRAPVALAPLFLATARGRLSPEIEAALPARGARWAFTWSQLRRIAGAPTWPARMARRMRHALAENFGPDGAAVRVPTLVLTGDAALDRVVPVASSREYLHDIRGARHIVLPETGHLGVVTRPVAWASIVGTFAREAAHRSGWPPEAPRQLTGHANE
jgi:pimeloyl-ACP methyl ester carboxylesterase